MRHDDTSTTDEGERVVCCDSCEALCFQGQGHCESSRPNIQSSRPSIETLPVCSESSVSDRIVKACATGAEPKDQMCTVLYRQACGNRWAHHSVGWQECSDPARCCRGHERVAPAHLSWLQACHVLCTQGCSPEAWDGQDLACSGGDSGGSCVLLMLFHNHRQAPS